MGGLFGGGGGTTQAPTTYQNPQVGTNQILQPPGQQQAAGLFYGLENQLNNLGWSGLSSLPGGVTATTQLYPQVQNISQNIAGVDPGVPYSYGSYGNVGLQGALTAAQMGLDPGGLLSLLYGQAGGLAGEAAAAGGNVFQNAFDPIINQVLSQISNNPYFSQAMTGAQTGAGIGGQTAQDVYGQVPGLISGAAGLPAAGAGAAATTGAQTPTIQGLFAQQAGLATPFTQEALALNPQLATLYGQTVPGLQSLSQGVQGAVAPNVSALNTLYGQTVPGIQNYAGGIGQEASFVGDLARSITGQGQLTSGAQNILNTGFDPRRALYNQTAQQTLDQANAAAALSGVAGTPYAAGTAANAAQNFNINWQNQQLARQQAALAAAGGAYGQAAGLTQAQGGLASTAGGLQGQAAGTLAEAAGTGNTLLDQMLNAQLQGGTTAGNLLAQAGGAGSNLISAQLANLTGAGNIYNQQAQGAANLASTIGGLGTTGLTQQLTGQTGLAGLLQSALGLGTGAAGTTAQFSQLPYQLQTQQGQNVLNALLQRNQLGAQGVGALAAATGALGQAGTTGTAGLQNYASIQGLPYTTALQQQTNAYNALTGQTNFGNQLLQLPQQSLQNLESYLGLGQSASQIGGQLSNIGFGQNQANLANLGSLINTGLGGGTLGNLLYGGQGLSGALGLGSTGLLGSLPSASVGGLSAAEQVGLGIPGATTGGGILGFLGNIGSGIASIFG